MQYYVKRCIALPGDTLEIRGGFIKYVDVTNNWEITALNTVLRTWIIRSSMVLWSVHFRMTNKLDGLSVSSDLCRFPSVSVSCTVTGLCEGMEYKDNTYLPHSCFYRFGIYSFYGGRWKRGFLVPFGSRYYRRVSYVYTWNIFVFCLYSH